MLVHGVDPRNYDEHNRLSFTHSLAEEIRFVQEDKGISRVIVLGDFNL